MVNARTKKDETVAAAPAAAAPAAAAAPVKKAKAAAPKKESEHPPYKVNTSTTKSLGLSSTKDRIKIQAVVMDRRR